MNVNIRAPGPIWTALTPDQRRVASAYEAELRAMPATKLWAEYEAQCSAFYSGDALACFRVVECRRECRRRLGIEEVAA